jgi:type II secretory pathway pseudopilin PulG
MKKASGMTLVELLVTLLLSSIMFIILGHIVVAANAWWLTSVGKVQLEDDMRYAKRRIEVLLRNAFANNQGGSISAVGSGHTHYGVECGDGQYLQFNGGDTIKLVNDQLIYFKAGIPASQEVLLRNVIHANFHVMDAAPDPGSSRDNGAFAWIELVSRKTLQRGTVIQSSSTVMVQNMNSGL